MHRQKTIRMRQEIEESPTRPEGGAATVQCRAGRSLLRQSAVCSPDSVRLSRPRVGAAGIGPAPTLDQQHAQHRTRAPQAVKRDGL